MRGVYEESVLEECMGDCMSACVYDYMSGCISLVYISSVSTSPHLMGVRKILVVGIRECRIREKKAGNTSVSNYID
jgi:hypothetical protein